MYHNYLKNKIIGLNNRIYKKSFANNNKRDAIIPQFYVYILNQHISI